MIYIEVTFFLFLLCDVFWSFSDLRFLVFMNFKNFGFLSLRFSLFSFRNSNYMYIRSLKVRPQPTNVPFIFFQSSYFNLSLLLIWIVTIAVPPHLLIFPSYNNWSVIINMNYLFHCKDCSFHLQKLGLSLFIFFMSLFSMPNLPSKLFGHMEYNCDNCFNVLVF